MRKKKKAKSELRHEKIELLLTEEEKDKVVIMSKEEGLPISTFIRWKLLKS